MTDTPPPVTPPPIESTVIDARISGLAIASLILAAVGFLTLGLTALVGFVLGIVALVSISRSGGRLRGTGLAIGGIVTSVAMLFVGCLSIGLLLPALAKARTVAGVLREEATLQVVSFAFDEYADTHEGRLPPVASWDTAMADLLGGIDLSAPRQGPGVAYAMNEHLEGTVLADLDPMTPLMFECPPGSARSGGPADLLAQPPRYRSRQGYLVLFPDGTVDAIPPEMVETLPWVPQGPDEP